MVCRTQYKVIYTHVNDKKPHVRDDITDESIVNNSIIYA